MSIRRSGGHLNGEPVVDYAACTFCGRSPLLHERYGCGEKDRNLTPLTCLECFTKPENQEALREAQREAGREERKQRWSWLGRKESLAIIAFILVPLAVCLTLEPWETIARILGGIAVIAAIVGG